MKYNEWVIQNGKGIFTELFNQYSFSFKDELTPEKLDSIYLLKKGDTTLTYTFERLAIEEVVNTIILMYAKKWEKIYNSLISMPDLEIEKEITSTNDNTKTSETENNNVNKNNVSAFDSNEMVLDKEDIQNNSENNIVSSQNTSTNTTKNYMNVNRRISMLESKNICDILIADVATIISLSIY